MTSCIASREASRAATLSVLVSILWAAQPAPTVAQATHNPHAVQETPLPPAPALPEALAVDDPAVELAYWETVEASEDAKLYLAYLEQFPNGTFRDIARERLDALWDRAVRAFALLEQMGIPLDDAPSGAGAAAAPPAVPAPAPAVVAPPIAVAPAPPEPAEPASWDRIRNTQNQLRKHGCYKGALDGIWGQRSRASMRRFNRLAGTSFSAARPSAAALKRMRELTQSGVRICR